MAVQWRAGVRAAGSAGRTGDDGRSGGVRRAARARRPWSTARRSPPSDVAGRPDRAHAVLPGRDDDERAAVLVQEPTVVELAEEKGVGVSDEDAQALLDQVVAAEGRRRHRDVHGAVAGGRPLLDRVQQPRRTSPDAAAIGDEIDTRLRDLDIEVNPRFGSLEDGNQIAAPAPLPWIVAPQAGSPADDGSTEPAPTPAPTPTAK